MMKALITGITGQDGAYLARALLDKGYEVYGTFRRTSEMHVERLKMLGIAERINFVPLELLEFTNLYGAIERIQPDEIYNLGAQSFVGMSFDVPLFTADVTGLGPLRLLEAVKTINPKIKFYQASSSEMFGKVQTTPQNEKTPFYPRSPYAVAKLFAHWAAVNYRESYGMFVCSGILFNHESPLRGHEFVTRKITQSVARIKLGLQKELLLGNLEAKRDWGYAPEYVKAMQLMLQQSQPDDYVIATGEAHSVREFAELAFKQIGIEIAWSGSGVDEVGMDKSSGVVRLRIDPRFFRPAEVDHLIGDYSKAEARLQWSPRTSFAELVGLMVEHDLKIAAQTSQGT
jgi:GDPmannose 4,6-dehydratase